MAELTLVGDELRLDGETVATVVPRLRASLRGYLEDTFGSRSYAAEYADPRELNERNDRTIAEMRASRRQSQAA